MDALCAAVGQMVYQAAHAWKAKGRVAAGTRDENAVNLSRPHEGLLKQLPLRVLAAVKQPVALALAQRHRRRRPVASGHIQSLRSTEQSIQTQDYLVPANIYNLEEAVDKCMYDA
jgi:hypothetical protein